MEQYGTDELLRLAKRHHNTKRTYLLVNPLQGKHIPVSPTRCLDMLRTLGSRFAEVAPETDLVIGFAETATAVGAMVAAGLSDTCRYIHTTREPAVLTGDMVEFREEHSHAAEQFLRAERLGNWIREAKTIAFVDDELSTGKTLLNVIAEIRERFPEAEGKPVWAVSVINRLTEERIALLESHGVRCFSLLRLPMEDLTSRVGKYDISAPARASADEDEWEIMTPAKRTEDTRVGCEIGEFTDACREMNEEIIGKLCGRLRGKRVTVLGTEEWMLPGLLLGEELEKRGEAASVVFHATTRSPIGICGDAEYPVKSGIETRSFYETDRVTYLYNLRPCDAVVVLSDSGNRTAIRNALGELRATYVASGCGEFILIGEAAHVRNLPE